MEDVRIIAKGRIADLSKGFSLGGVPFSVYVRSKENTMLSDTLLDCRLIGDREKGGAFPVPIGDWTPAMIAYISPNAIDLQKYEVYWGASEQPNKIVEFVNLEMDSMPLVYESVQALSTIPGPLRKNPKPFKKPVFLRLFYNGKNVKGYTMSFADNTYTKSSTTSRDTWKYYYLTKDATYANAYWLDVKGIRVAIKKELKFALKDFPEVIKKIENDEISLKEFKKDPKMILPLLDQSYKK